MRKECNSERERTDAPSHIARPRDREIPSAQLLGLSGNFSLSWEAESGESAFALFRRRKSLTDRCGEPGQLARPVR